ncbi:MAG: hypothetical protein HY537_06105 [Deltaproteobacteria bacterium]|nr:hypothetical protein [Deltaproteobacteria bacterium]
MTTFKDLFIFSAVVALLTCSQRAIPATLNWSLNPLVIQPGSRTTMQIKLPTHALVERGLDPAKVEPTLRLDLLDATPLLRILHSSHSRTQTEQVWQFQITAYRVGRFWIPPIEVTAGPLTFSTESISLEVSGVGEPVDQPLPGPDPIALRSSFWIWLLGCLFALFAGGLAGLMAYKKRKKMSRAHPLAVQIAPTQSDFEWLKHELAALRTLLAHGQNDIIDEYTNTLRAFFSRRHAFAANTYTTYELRQKLGNNALTSTLWPLLDRCDAHKFAKQTAQPEILGLRCIEETEDLLNQCHGI